MPWLDQSELSVQPQLEQASAVLVNAALAASSVAQVRDWGSVFMKFPNGVARRRRAQVARGRCLTAGCSDL